MTVPTTWKVLVERQAVLGGVDANVTPAEELPDDAPVLRVEATARFGGVAIKAKDAAEAWSPAAQDLPSSASGDGARSVDDSTAPSRARHPSTSSEIRYPWARPAPPSATEPAAMVFTTARPTAPPTWRLVLRRPEAAPAWAGGTPARPAIVTGMKQRAKPMPLSTKGPSRSTV